MKLKPAFLTALEALRESSWWVVLVDDDESLGFERVEMAIKANITDVMKYIDAFHHRPQQHAI